jgi:hypothetical protein
LLFEVKHIKTMRVAFDVCTHHNAPGSRPAQEFSLRANIDHWTIRVLDQSTGRFLAGGRWNSSSTYLSSWSAHL